MLLCSPSSHHINHEFHDPYRARRGTMSSHGGSISSASSRHTDYSAESLSNRSSYSQAGSQSHNQMMSPTRLLTSPHGLTHNHNPFAHDQEAWYQHVTNRVSADQAIQISSAIPYSAQQIISPAVTAAWSPQDALEATTWQDVPAMNEYTGTIQSIGNFSWATVDSTTAWSMPAPATYDLSISSTLVKPEPSMAVVSVVSDDTAPYRHDSFFAYKREDGPGMEMPAYTDMDISAEIQYPNIYTDTVHPVRHAYDTNVADVEALKQAVTSDTIIGSDILSDPSAQQAISTAIAKSSTGSNHDHHRGAIVKMKAAPKGGRVGPLTVTQREKVEDMRSYGACWRCRKYKKPCNGPGICNTCVTSGFRVWPSALGCRRGDFDSFAFGMIPTHAEQVVGQMVMNYTKPAGWRKISKMYSSQLIIPLSAAHGDRFEQLMLRVQQTRLTGPGIMELLEIACNLQRGLTKESRVLANTLKGLGHACEFYACFVATEDNQSILPNRYDVVNIFTSNRKALLTTLSSFLNSCLTGRMKDWLPTFLSANFIVFTFVMLSDAAVMVPAQYRDKLWASIRAIIMDFRGILYPMAQDLLSALGKGSKLLHMQCWTMVEKPSEDPDEPVKLERSQEGMNVVDQEIALFDGLRNLQLWHETYGALMRQDQWFNSAPLTVEVLPVCALERLFDFSPRG